MKICVLFLLVVSLACSNVRDLNDEVESVSINADIIKLGSPELILAEQAIITNDYLITAHRNTDSLFKVFNLTDGRYIGNFGTVGYGPSDYLDVEYRSIQTVPSGLAAIEASSNQIVFIDIYNYQEEFAFSRKRSVQVPLRTQFTNDMILFRDSLVIGHSNGDLMEKELFSFNINSEELFEFGEYQDLGWGQDLPINLKYELYFKKLVKHPNKERFGVLYTKHNKIVVYDYNINVINEMNLSIDSKEVPLWDNGIIDYSNAHSFNLHVAASDEYIFGLTTGSTNAELSIMSTNEMLEMRSEIYVWNWNGEIVFKLILDRPISIITYDYERDRIIGISPYIEDEIYLYEMPNFK